MADRKNIAKDASQSTPAICSIADLKKQKIFLHMPGQSTSNLKRYLLEFGANFENTLSENVTCIIENELNKHFSKENNTIQSLLTSKKLSITVHKLSYIIDLISMLKTNLFNYSEIAQHLRIEYLGGCCVKINRLNDSQILPTISTDNTDIINYNTEIDDEEVPLNKLKNINNVDEKLSRLRCVVLLERLNLTPVKKETPDSPKVVKRKRRSGILTEIVSDPSLVSWLVNQSPTCKLWRRSTRNDNNLGELKEKLISKNLNYDFSNVADTENISEESVPNDNNHSNLSVNDSKQSSDVKNIEENRLITTCGNSKIESIKKEVCDMPVNNNRKNKKASKKPKRTSTEKKLGNKSRNKSANFDNQLDENLINQRESIESLIPKTKRSISRGKNLANYKRHVKQLEDDDQVRNRIVNENPSFTLNAFPIPIDDKIFDASDDEAPKIDTNNLLNTIDSAENLLDDTDIEDILKQLEMFEPVAEEPKNDFEEILQFVEDYIKTENDTKLENDITHTCEILSQLDIGSYTILDDLKEALPSPNNNSITIFQPKKTTTTSSQPKPVTQKKTKKRPLKTNSSGKLPPPKRKRRKKRSETDLVKITMPTVKNTKLQIKRFVKKTDLIGPANELYDFDKQGEIVETISSSTLSSTSTSSTIKKDVTALPAKNTDYTKLEAVQTNGRFILRIKKGKEGMTSFKGNAENGHGSNDVGEMDNDNDELTASTGNFSMKLKLAKNYDQSWRFDMKKSNDTYNGEITDNIYKDVANNIACNDDDKNCQCSTDQTMMVNHKKEKHMDNEENNDDDATCKLNVTENNMHADQNINCEFSQEKLIKNKNASNNVVDDEEEDDDGDLTKKSKINYIKSFL